uniref:Uncharacterized protein n=1 Tax=Cucumis melo TaxID=3656 RepID=A0A9I9ELD9_CUCME
MGSEQPGIEGNLRVCHNCLFVMVKSKITNRSMKKRLKIKFVNNYRDQYKCNDPTPYTESKSLLNIE